MPGAGQYDPAFGRSGAGGGPDIFGIYYPGGPAYAPEPGTDLVEAPPLTEQPRAVPGAPDWGPGGAIPDFTRQTTGQGQMPDPFDIETLDPNRLPGGFGAPIPSFPENRRGAGFMDFPTSYSTDAANKAAQAGVPIPGAGRTGQPAATAAAAPAAAKATGQFPNQLQAIRENQQQALFKQLLAMLTGGSGAFTPAAVPDFRQEAMGQAELMRRRAGQRQAEEAAATGGAGSRDLGYRQSLLDEAMLQAGGGIGAEQAGRQFQANLQAKALEAQQKQAEFRQVIAMLQALGGFTGGGMGGA